jgi:hypothetical protein
MILSGGEGLLRISVRIRRKKVHGMNDFNVIRNEIPQEEWPEFILGFGSSHENWLVTITYYDKSSDVRTDIVGDMPLEDIELMDDGNLNIIIKAGKNSTAQVTHLIKKPEHIVLERNERGADVGLEITNYNKETTFLRFRTAAIPVMVDGIVPDQ